MKELMWAFLLLLVVVTGSLGVISYGHRDKFKAGDCIVWHHEEEFKDDTNFYYSVIKVGKRNYLVHFRYGEDGGDTLPQSSTEERWPKSEVNDTFALANDVYCEAY